MILLLSSVEMDANIFIFFHNGLIHLYVTMPTAKGNTAECLFGSKINNS